MTRSIVAEYWQGVLQRLRAEVDVFAQLVEHNAERGRENEAAFARVLTAFVPQRFGVGTGLVIDRDGNSSRQMDIVLFEQADEPRVLAQTNQLLFPVETTAGVIEVKTRFSTDDVQDCARKAKSIGDLNRGDHAGPSFTVLAYNSEVLATTLHERFSALDASEQPDLVCVLDEGILLGHARLLKTSADTPDEFVGGYAALRTDGGDTGEADWVPGSPTGSMQERYGTRYYTVIDHQREHFLADPGRALLLYIEALARLLATRAGRDEPVLSAYLDRDARELLWF